MYYHTGVLQENETLVNIVLYCTMIIGLPYFLFMKTYEYGESYLSYFLDGFSLYTPLKEE